jgi:hypothetical protein
MKYFELSIGIGNIKYGNDFSSKEITESEYLKAKKYYESNKDSNDDCNITWDFQTNYGTGYVVGIATEENFSKIKSLIFEKSFDFFQKSLEWRKLKIKCLNDEIYRLEKHPIYETITKALNREEKINQILN